ncbi:uncharacterized protein LOC132556426 [Ylistrum balloti]|uniref:uncharacterized protein LOC132556426 n=1 Tax=Ylistrum balloti TaxID=509963 RepID=UPI002905E2F1|nr:uncharacterized protein LOC132556426 [Ylistrum balloti]
MQHLCLLVLFSVLLGNGDAQEPCGDVDKTLGDFEMQRYFMESPSGFENGLTCTWTVRAANSGSRIAYQLIDINLGIDDFVNVYAGTSANDPVALQNYTATSASISVKSVNSSNIYVTLQTGNDPQSKRQSLDSYYMAGTDKSGAVSCVNQMLTATAEPQFLTSPSFPAKYPLSKQCNWTINAPESATLELTFLMIDIEVSADCQYDRLIIYLPGGKELSICKRGVWVPETHTIAHNQVHLDFSGDDSDSFAGFVLTYKAIIPPPITTTTAPAPTPAKSEYDSSGCNGEACNQPTVSGSCLAYFKKFTFDAGTKACKEFIYGGCGGNNNRFDTLEDCQATCLSKSPTVVHFNTQGRVRNDTCDLPLVTGPCRGAFPKYGYDTASKACKEFLYGGCDGNANRFDSKELCENSCITTTENTCDLPLVTGPCRGAFQKYGYDTATKACKEFLYGGCHGNANRFDSMELCENSCITTTENTCDLPLVKGPCRGAFPKYGYDTAIKACKEFVYGGCDGNANRFDSMELCENSCITTTESRFLYLFYLVAEHTLNKETCCEVVSCVIPIIVVVVLVIAAVSIAIVLVRKRRNDSTKYAPTAAREPGDVSEMKVAPDAAEKV